MINKKINLIFLTTKNYKENFNKNLRFVEIENFKKLIYNKNKI